MDAYRAVVNSGHQVQRIFQHPRIRMRLCFLTAIYLEGLTQKFYLNNTKLRQLNSWNKVA